MRIRLANACAHIIMLWLVWPIGLVLADPFSSSTTSTSNQSMVYYFCSYHLSCLPNFLPLSHSHIHSIALFYTVHFKHYYNPVRTPISNQTKQNAVKQNKTKKRPPQTQNKLTSKTFKNPFRCSIILIYTVKFC